MLHFKEYTSRSWPRRVLLVGKEDASAASSGGTPNPGWFCAARKGPCLPCPGTGRIFPSLLERLLTRLSILPRRCSLHRPWSTWFGLCAIMQEHLALPCWERKELLMIRVLAHIISRQVYRPQVVSHEALDSPPRLCQQGEQTRSLCRARSRTKASSPETLSAGTWPDPPAQSLVVLFTEPAQRRVQTAHAQEETHE
jgi:hypothetical protein